MPSFPSTRRQGVTRILSGVFICTGCAYGLGVGLVTPVEAMIRANRPIIAIQGSPIIPRAALPSTPWPASTTGAPPVAPTALPALFYVKQSTAAELIPSHEGRDEIGDCGPFHPILHLSCAMIMG